MVCLGLGGVQFVGVLRVTEGQISLFEGQLALGHHEKPRVITRSQPESFLELDLGIGVFACQHKLFSSLHPGDGGRLGPQGGGVIHVTL